MSTTYVWQKGEAQLDALAERYEIGDDAIRLSARGRLLANEALVAFAP